MKKLMKLQSRLLVTAAVLGLILPIAVTAETAKLDERDYYKDARKLPAFEQALEKKDDSSKEEGEELSFEEQLKKVAAEQKDKGKFDQEKLKEISKLSETRKQEEKALKAAITADVAKERVLQVKKAINEKSKAAIDPISAKGQSALCGIQRPKDQTCLTNVNIDEMCTLGKKAISDPSAQADSALRGLLEDASKGKKPGAEQLANAGKLLRAKREAEALKKKAADEQEELKAKLAKMSDEEQIEWLKKQNSDKNPNGAPAALAAAQAEQEKKTLDLMKLIATENVTQEKIKEALAGWKASQEQALESLAKSAQTSVSWVSQNGLTILDKQLGRKRSGEASPTLLGKLAKKIKELYQNEPQRNAVEIQTHQNNVSAANSIQKGYVAEADKLAGQFQDRSGQAKAAFDNVDLDSVMRRATNVENTAAAILSVKGQIEDAQSSVLAMIQPGLQQCDVAVELKQRVENKLAETKKKVKEVNEANALAAQQQQQMFGGTASAGRPTPGVNSFAGGSSPSNHFSQGQRQTN